MKSNLKQDKFLSTVIDNLKVPTIAQIKALELFLSSSSDKINSEEKDLIELTLNSCNNMQKMIDNFSFITKLNSEKMNLSYKYFKFNELLDGIIKEADIFLKYSNINIDINLSSEVEIYADIFKIKKAVENILSFVINSCVKNSTINIFINTDTTHLKFEIISKGCIENGFDFIEILNQNKDCSSKYMELFIAKEIIKAHFGKIIIKNSENNLNTIGFTLPIK